MPNADHVTVSCLQVTLPIPQRSGYFSRSLAAYCRQTHSNTELVIVLDEGTAEARASIAAQVASLGRQDIRIVEPAGKRPLGALRNVSVDHARGDILCQWDDDDLHHPQRVERQLDSLLASGGNAVYLEDAMQFFPDARTLQRTLPPTRSECSASRTSRLPLAKIVNRPNATPMMRHRRRRTAGRPEKTVETGSVRTDDERQF